MGLEGLTTQMEPAAHTQVHPDDRASAAAAAPIYDVLVVGGGIVGLATSLRLLQARPSLRLLILERESELATHQSGHNSGVMHAGLYYQPGSLKANLCREGKADLERFCEVHAIPFERVGKLVVALDDGELGRLDTIHQRATANQVPGLEMVGPERLVASRWRMRTSSALSARPSSSAGP